MGLVNLSQPFNFIQSEVMMLLDEGEPVGPFEIIQSIDQILRKN